MNFSVLGKRLLIAVLALVVFQLLSLIWFVHSLKDVDRVIAEDIVVTSQWSEIKLQRPLSASQRPQLISVDLKSSGGATNPASGFTLKVHESREAPPETIAVPEIQLVDQDGYAYDLQAGKATRSGNSVVVPFELNKGPGFNKDRTYNLVRIRSDERVQCNKVIWHDRK
jgi:hypothetical protein